ncbi:Uncharacterised protein [Mycobacteroides abscessus subsp. massiliense]|nr:Uncharacterised protein [Mycobacteroides abscessus subsp. massiliense]
MDVGVVGQLDAPWVHHHQVRPSQGSLLDACSNDWMRLGGVGSTDEDRACRFDVIEGIRRCAGTEYGLEPGGTGCMANPRATVHVVSAQGDTRELLGKVVLLVGGPCRREDTHRFWPPPFDKPPKTISRSGYRFVPLDRLPITRVLAQHRGCDAVRRSEKTVTVAALDTKVPSVDGGIVRRAYCDDMSITNADKHFTAHPAIRTHRARPIGDRSGGVRVR